MDDALRKTHYQTATGVITGLLESEAFGKFLESKEDIESLQEYHASVAAAREGSRQKVDEYLEDQAQQDNQDRNFIGIKLLQYIGVRPGFLTSESYLVEVINESFQHACRPAT